MIPFRGALVALAIVVLAASSALILSSGQVGVSDSAMSKLVEDLRTTFPDQIDAIDFENAPPLDPPTIFIDFDQGSDDTTLLRLLCDDVKPRVLAVDRSIDVFADGWTLSGSC